jgi:serine/threonine-protein kinase
MAETRTDTDLAALVGAKLGNYRLTQLLGRGQMGVVYLATDEALLRPTAIKLLSWVTPDAPGHDPVQWFLAEARMVARINHPRVVQIYGAARQADLCYIAMEYVPGTSAEAMVAKDGAMPPERATDILLQAASALHAAHRSGVVHRDVKPGNLLIGPGGHTKLGDFGMALGSVEALRAAAQSRAGTPYYTAPEIWRGEPASPASDIYALGATYFQLLTGRPPFRGADLAAVEAAHLKGPIPDPREIVPGLPASCAALVRRALAKAPQDRHPSAQVLLWEGRRVLVELEARVGASGLRRSSPRADVAGAQDQGPPLEVHAIEPPPPVPPALAVLEFVDRPFSLPPPGKDPYQIEPFHSARAGLTGFVEVEASPVGYFTGAEGSGRTQLCRLLAAEQAKRRLVIHLDVLRDLGDRTLLQRLSRSTGGVEESAPAADEQLEGLLTRLDAERHQYGQPPLLILSGVAAGQSSQAQLGSLVAAGLWSGGFKVLLVGPPGLAEALSRAGIPPRRERLPEIALGPLDRVQTADYVRGWVRLARGDRARQLFLSPEALLLIHQRTRGVLARIDCVAENMLLLAAESGARVVTSWFAWTASDTERWADSARAAPLPRRPSSWPSPEAENVMNQCRKEVGLPPRPRSRSAPPPPASGLPPQ